MVGFTVVPSSTRKKIVFEAAGPAPLELLDQVHELHRQIDLHYARMPQSRPIELVSRGLLLTKGEPTYLQKAEAFVLYQMRELAVPDLRKNWDLEGIAKKTHLLDSWWEKSRPIAEELRGRIAELISDPAGATKRHQDSDRKLLQTDLTVIPYFDEEGTPVCHYFPKTAVAAYTLVVKLLSSNESKLLQRVYKCEWEPCSAYFLRPDNPMGGRPRQYCLDSDCQKMPDRSQSLIRQAKPDQRQKQAERKRRAREAEKKCR